MTTEITVRGSYSAFQPPERATVRASLGFEGPQMQPVYDRVVRDLESWSARVVGEGRTFAELGAPWARKA